MVLVRTHRRHHRIRRPDVRRIRNLAVAAAVRTARTPAVRIPAARTLAAGDHTRRSAGTRIPAAAAAESQSSVCRRVCSADPLGRTSSARAEAVLVLRSFAGWLCFRNLSAHCSRLVVQRLRRAIVSFLPLAVARRSVRRRRQWIFHLLLWKSRTGYWSSGCLFRDVSFPDRCSRAVRR